MELTPPDPHAPADPRLAAALAAWAAGDLTTTRAHVRALEPDAQALDAADRGRLERLRRGLSPDPAGVAVAVLGLLAWLYLWWDVAMA